MIGEGWVWGEGETLGEGRMGEGGRSGGRRTGIRLGISGIPRERGALTLRVPSESAQTRK